MNRVVRSIRVGLLSQRQNIVCQTRLSSQEAVSGIGLRFSEPLNFFMSVINFEIFTLLSANTTEVGQFDLPDKVKVLYEKSPDGLVYGIDENMYLELKEQFPTYFSEYIENDLIWDQTKTAMMIYMQTGEGNFIYELLPAWVFNLKHFRQNLNLENHYECNKSPNKVLIDNKFDSVYEKQDYHTRFYRNKDKHSFKTL